MIYGMYLSGQGAEAQALRQTVLANNLANAGTTAFKRDVSLFKAHPQFEQMLGQAFTGPQGLEEMTGGVTLEGTVTDFSQGSLRETGAPLDLGLLGNGFLQVTDGQQNYLTRDGRLALDNVGQLVLGDKGLKVLSQTGQPMIIPPGVSNLNISANGVVTGQFATGETEVFGQLAAAEPLSLIDLVKRGDGLYTVNGPVRPPSPEFRIRQGYLEESGAQPVRGMLELIETSRAFETNINMVKHQDEMLGRLIDSLPRR